MIIDKDSALPKFALLKTTVFVETNIFEEIREYQTTLIRYYLISKQILIYGNILVGYL